ncbi:MAG: alpha/beta hydrolase [Labilithrix sp.]|nr:alpha/beta hydrolase [Labilithrix sp.]MCW5815140.1 alpha/beta hydrolase [Labilithrix sp.]
MTEAEAIPVATALPRPVARRWDSIRVVGAAVGAMLRALVRRLFGRGVNPKWPLGLELVIAATRGSWSVMPAIGMVRWRNVGEAMSPLKTDDLTPRFVNVSAEGGRPLYAAWLEPPDAGASVLLYFHGGGFVFGSLRTHGEMIGALARAARARTLSLEYRLAPEHPAPAAVTDAVAAYRYLLDRGVAPANVALAGDSAGGTLTIATLIALRDEGLPLPGAAVAISPWVDLACSGASFDENARYDFVGKEHCQLAARHYAASADVAALSPFAASLAGLPPLLVQAGSLETLVDQIRVFAARAKDAGNAVTYAEYPEMVHVWHLLRRMTPEGTKAIDEAGAFIRTHTAVST